MNTQKIKAQGLRKWFSQESACGISMKTEYRALTRSQVCSCNRNAAKAEMVVFLGLSDHRLPTTQ